MVTMGLIGIGVLGLVGLMISIVTLRQIQTSKAVLQALQTDVNSQLTILHGEINSRLSQLLQSTQQASELVGRAAERADRLAEERATQEDDPYRRRS